ncbi:hypothetical protein DL93DRAFT_2231827 [Clavulina sp. PMI_390]|nr:hypothetical protein DL93DRAFT_2231827 [Clavulina sp. PMI_390]
MPLFSPNDPELSAGLDLPTGRSGLTDTPPLAPLQGKLTIAKTIVTGRPEEVFGRRLVVNTAADDQADRIHDGMAKVADIYQHGNTLYGTNKKLINDAWHAIETAGVGRTIDDWIGPINKVMNGLLGLAKAQPFPFVELAVTLFNGVVQLEVQRRQNSTKARALILQMADMMSALLQLHFVKDPTLVTENGDSVQGRIETLVKDIEQDIINTGNLINKYHQHRLISKFFQSGQYAALFKAAGDILVSRKGDIQYACTIHTTVTVDEIRQQVRETNAMVLKLTRIIEHQMEQQQQQMMPQYSTPTGMLETSEVDNKIGPILADYGKASGTIALSASHDPNNPDQTILKVTPKDAMHPPAAVSNKPVYSHKELFELAQPLEQMLQDSRPYYECKLMAQVEFIKKNSNKWTRGKQPSSRMHMMLKAGPFSEIMHPDIRLVWKNNTWQSSIKAKKFVIGLSDYDLDRYADAAAAAESFNTDTAVAMDEPLAEDIHLHSPTSDESILSDKDYLEYLSLPYARTIAEAIDDNAGEYVRVSDVNDFAQSIPMDWTLLQWIAYWSQGWAVEAAYYSLKIWDIYKIAQHGLANMPANDCNNVFQYLHDLSWVHTMRQLTWCAASKSTWRTDSPLDDLVRKSMVQKETRLEYKLEGFGFIFDSVESVKLVMDSTTFEKDLFALFFVLIRRHIRLIPLAKANILSEHDMWYANDTMLYLVEAIKGRVEQLQSIYKRQGLDADKEMSYRAGGVYEAIHSGSMKGIQEPICPDEVKDQLWEMLFPSDLTIRKFGHSDTWYDMSIYKKELSLPIGMPAEESSHDQ